MIMKAGWIPFSYHTCASVNAITRSALKKYNINKPTISKIEKIISSSLFKFFN